MNPAKEEYGFFFKTNCARDKNRPSNLAEIPQPTPASLGVLTAEAGTPPERSAAIKSSVCARERNTANVVMIFNLPSYNRL